MAEPDLRRGVVISLGSHVVLCLHRCFRPVKARSVAGLLGVSRCIDAVRAQILQVARTDLPVLILGASGTGKELVAQAIHAGGRRAEGPLVSINSAGLSEGLAAAELFGALKGAYTGATDARPGLLVEADRGTLFLDEIGDMPAGVQPLLLRALETGAVRAVGASRDRHVDVRFIAATDRDLASGFNQPLLRRLEGFVIRMPELAERREDVGLLIRHFLESRTSTSADRFPAWIVAHLARSDLPGNVRQLAQLVVRAELELAAGATPDIDAWLAYAPAEEQSSPEGHGAGEPAKKVKPSTITDAALVAALERADWCVKHAASDLGISRPSIYNLIARSERVRNIHAISRTEILAAMDRVGMDPLACANELQTPLEGLRRRIRSIRAEENEQ
ncbi:MAG: sigma 54-interacting transcriptional regulator [Pseudomonadota bacterium]